MSSVPPVAGSDEAARRRIQAAYDPQLFQDAGRKLADLLAEHLQLVQNSGSVVLNWADPRDSLQRALQTLIPGASGSAATQPAPQPQRGTGSTAAPINLPGSAESAESRAHLVDHFAELVGLALSRGHNLHDPRYVGHQVPPPVPIAGLFDSIGAVTNQPMAIYEMGPWATAVEQAMIGKLADAIGWAGTDYGGIVTHGASLANLTSLLVARNVALAESWERGMGGAGPAPVLVSQADAHYCIARSAGILGLGTNQVVKATLDDRRRMDPQKLDATLAELKSAGHPIIAVVACACATPVGAFDPLEAIADACEKHRVWLHVDAAHGGAALLSPRYRHLVAGLERADSLTWDAHKMLFVPALCAFLFYKRKQDSYAAFRQNAPYLFDPSSPGLDDFESGLRTVECTKRAAAFGLWGVWSLFGPQLFADLVNVTFDLGKTFYTMLSATSDFMPLNEPECNIVVFRHIPEVMRGATPERVSEFQWQLRRAVIESGEFYLVPTMFQGVAALRCALMNPLTTPAHLARLLETLRARGREILGQGLQGGVFPLS